MTISKKLGLLVPMILAVLVAGEGDASACGGCFVPPDENTQVTGHRMVMSIGMSQSTLYDQIEYTGNPASFAWVLPINGEVGVDVSSDLLFNQLGFDTAVSIAAPPLDCPFYNCGQDSGTGFGSSSTGSGGATDAENGGVTVIAQEVVGPYETVQLKTTSPTALQDWLKGHGYSLPAEIAPLVTAYVNEGFNFLAVKLVPGKAVSAMQPIRVTTTGASVALPLRMVAAGTGATTTVTLYVVSEFRAEASNFPNFDIEPASVLWNYDLDRSNYTEQRDLAYKASGGLAWLTEAARPYSAVGFRNQITNVVDFAGPVASGYGVDEQDFEGAHAKAQEDLDTLFAGMNEGSVWVTRMRAELSKSALATDLGVAAADAQDEVSNFIQTTKFVGTQPACPPPPPGCEEGTTGVTTGGSGVPWGVDDDGPGGGTGCSMGTPAANTAAVGAAMLLLGAGATLRRRKQR
ncbi:MAG: DUF2330 domain-containing protein [Myxococcales bacterium]|nr:DUF2330 domain-containing protein [Myxococcales bacterium]